MVDYAAPKIISLREHPELSEKWVQARIAENPAILGLGDLVLKDSERIHAGAGRLDLLLQDRESEQRYELELQLGRTDPGHIIRTIEYWDIEKTRYRRHEHTAVLVAEDITSRFLNVIKILNGAVPLVALQMQAIEVRGVVTLVFTKVIDVRASIEDAEEQEEPIAAEKADRGWWESAGTLALADRLFEDIKTFAPKMQLRYQKQYIGLGEGDLADNFVTFRPKRSALTVRVRLDHSEEVDKLIREAGLDLMADDADSGRYRVQVTPKSFDQQRTAIAELMRRSYTFTRG